jgi:hypothetical protein
MVIVSVPPGGRLAPTLPIGLRTELRLDSFIDPALLKKVEGVEFVAASDISPKALDKAKTDYALTNLYSDYKEMLKKHPHFEQFLGKDRPAACNPAEWALIRASNWPDWVRPSARDTEKEGQARVRFRQTLQSGGVELVFGQAALKLAHRLQGKALSQ